jgi:hypothetical protein
MREWAEAIIYVLIGVLAIVLAAAALGVIVGIVWAVFDWLALATAAMSTQGRVMAYASTVGILAFLGVIALAYLANAIEPKR